MTITEIEAAFSLSLPERHHAAILDRTDPIHEACEFLVADAPKELLPIRKTNEYLRKRPLEPWPTFLFAFASNGCGDYFAYDTRTSPYRIVYIDPDHSVEENLTSDDSFSFDSFEDWHQYKCQQRAEARREAASDAYRWIDANTDYMLETPDEAFDWVPMLTEYDWELLAATWGSRSSHAREAIAYVLCEGPTKESRAILLKALHDSDVNVASQAAQSLQSQREHDGDRFPPLEAGAAKLVDELADDDA